jgi:hypothetical protein
MGPIIVIGVSIPAQVFPVTSRPQRWGIKEGVEINSELHEQGGSANRNRTNIGKRTWLFGDVIYWGLLNMATGE